MILGSWFVSCYLFFIPGIMAGAYFGRTLIFLIFPFSVLIALAFSIGFKSIIGKTIQICVLLLIFSSAILIPITNYGGDYFEFIPDSFLLLQTNNAESNHSFLDLSSMPLDMWKLIPYSLLPLKNTTYISEGYNGTVISSQTFYNFYQVKYSKGEEYRSFFEQQNLHKVYTNGDVSIYKNFSVRS